MSFLTISTVPYYQVLLITWMDFPIKEYDMLDLFSGQQAISKTWYFTKFSVKAS